MFSIDVEEIVFWLCDKGQAAALSLWTISRESGLCIKEFLLCPLFTTMNLIAVS